MKWLDAKDAQNLSFLAKAISWNPREYRIEDRVLSRLSEAALPIGLVILDPSIGSEEDKEAARNVIKTQGNKKP